GWPGGVRGLRLAHPAKYHLVLGHIDLLALEAGFEPNLGQHAVEIVVAPPRAIARRGRQFGADDLFDFGELHRHDVATLLPEIGAEGAVFRHPNMYLM